MYPITQIVDDGSDWVDNLVDAPAIYFGGRHGFAEHEPLKLIASDPRQEMELFSRLYSFGNNIMPQSAGHADNGFQHRFAFGIDADTGNE